MCSDALNEPVVTDALSDFTSVIYALGQWILDGRVETRVSISRFRVRINSFACERASILLENTRTQESKSTRK